MTPEQISNIMSQETQFRGDKMNIANILRIAGAEERQFGLQKEAQNLDRVKTAASLLNSDREYDLSIAKQLLEEEKQATSSRYHKALENYYEGQIDVKEVQNELAHTKRILELEKLDAQRRKDEKYMRRVDSEIAVNEARIKDLENKAANRGKLTPAEERLRNKDFRDTEAKMIANIDKDAAVPLMQSTNSQAPDETTYGYIYDPSLLSDNIKKVELPKGLTLGILREAAKADGITIEEALLKVYKRKK